MSRLEIKQYPDKVLRRKSNTLKRIGQRETQLFEDMLLTMRHFQGVGLAAPQVGINQQIIVVDIGEGLIKLANPKVLEVKGKEKAEEGCLSIPGALVNIVRPYEAIVQGLNEKGEPVEIAAKGLLARVILHEIDHLNGKLIIDYMNLWEKINFKLGKARSSRC